MHESCGGGFPGWGRRSSGYSFGRGIVAVSLTSTQLELVKIKLSELVFELLDDRFQ